jgi:hypothetical protein
MAGGASTTIDQAPDEFQAGVSSDVTYTVLQHGVSPIDGETALIFSLDDGEPLRFVGTPTGTPGQYVATVELPTAGAWLMEVDQASFGVVEHDIVEVVGSGVSLPVSGGALMFGIITVAVALLAFVVMKARQASSPNSAPASRMTSST